MSVITMQVKTADDVEGSKNLRVYTFVAGETELTVVANRTNVYEVDDVALVVQVGTMLPERHGGFEITQRKVFGIESSGMAMGTTDLPPGVTLNFDEEGNLQGML
jgi:tRNA-binding EMAP/Myf-like protein